MSMSISKGITFDVTALLKRLPDAEREEFEASIRTLKRAKERKAIEDGAEEYNRNHDCGCS